jgi:aspartate aminotransferase
MQPSRRVSALAFSTTLALDAKAKALAAAGRDIINMSVGEPDFAAPKAVQDAASAKALSGDVRYTPAEGTLSLRKAIAARLTGTRGIPFTEQEIAVCHSAKHALSGACLSLIEPGDEVLLLLPAWVSYDEIVLFSGGKPVPVKPRKDCGPDLGAIAKAVSPRTRGIILNSPCNPSGYVLTQAEVRAIAALAEERDLWIVSDEIYRRLVYEGEPDFSPAQVSPAARARTVIVDGASKAFAMTGYRIGYAAAPPPIAAAIARLHSQLTGCPNAISQAAFEVALRSDSDGAEPPEVAAMVREFDGRRRVLVDGLEKIGLDVPWPRGAFYAFPDVSPWIDARGSTGFCEDLLEEQDLAVVPGSAFGVDDHVRLSYATSIGNIERALERFGKFLATRRRAPANATARAR